MRITQLHWDAISIDTDIDSNIIAPNVYVFWPSPIEYDPCFERAGLNEFESVDIDWKHAWRTTIDRAIKHLSQFGRPMLRNPVIKKTLLDHAKHVFRPFLHYQYKEPSLTDLVNLCSRQDGHPAAIVDFGDEHGLSLMSADGHPILWVLVDSRIGFSPVTMGQVIAPGVALERRSLDWAMLLPGRATHGNRIHG